MAQSTYRASVLWWVLARGLDYLPLERLFLASFLLERLLGIYAAGRLARSFVPGSPLAVFVARLLFCLPLSPPLGHGTLVRDYFEQTGFALPFLLLAVAEFREARPFRCAALLAVGLNLNCLVGAFAFSYLAVAFILDPARRNSWRAWALPAVLFLFMGIPVFILLLLHTPFGPPDEKLWLSASFLRSPHHLLPHTWAKKSFARYGLLVCVALFAFRKAKHSFESLSRDCLAWTAVSLAWLGCAFLSAYVFRVPFLLSLQPARGSDIWYCLASIGLISIAARRLEIRRDRVSLVSLMVLLAFLTAILTAAAGSRALGMTLLVLALVALLSKPMPVLRSVTADPRRLMGLLTALLLIVSMGVFLRRSAADGGVREGLMIEGAEPIRSVAEWARTHTSSDSLFLVDPLWSQFRALSERSAFVTWEDGTALFRDKSLATEWVGRLRRAGCDILTVAAVRHRGEIRRFLAEAYGGLRDEDVLRIRLDYPLDYWIVPRNHPTRFRSAFSDGRWLVLDLRSSTDAPQISPSREAGPPPGS